MFSFSGGNRVCERIFIGEKSTASLSVNSHAHACWTVSCFFFFVSSLLRYHFIGIFFPLGFSRSEKKPDAVNLSASLVSPMKTIAAAVYILLSRISKFEGSDSWRWVIPLENNPENGPGESKGGNPRGESTRYIELQMVLQIGKVFDFFPCRGG